jgi:CRISPR-associated endonuclease Cas1
MGGKGRRRDFTREATCQWCGVVFHPWHNEATKYCSGRCSSLAYVARINGKQPSTTPMPTRTAADAPIVNVNAETRQGQIPSSLNVNAAAEEYGREWRASGQHWEAVANWMAERAAARSKRLAERFEETGRQTAASEGRVLVLHGFGAGLFVKNGSLVVKHGRVFSDQIVEDEVLPRGEHGLSTLVWITNGGAGSLSIQALKWLAQQSVTLVLLSDHGRLLGTIYPSPDSPSALDVPGRDHRTASRPDITLRRAQYHLSGARQVFIARQLILRKVAGQLDTLRKHQELPDRARGLDAVGMALEWLSLSPPMPLLTSVEGIRLMESRAARGHYGGWQGMPLRVDASARQRWHPSWLTVGQRYSPLTRWHSPRHATNPAQGMLNWLYACLESQVRGALNVCGFDPAVGILHADDPNRDSLVYDVMEPLRGLLDDRCLSFLAQHTFSAGDFQQRSDGSVAVHPSLLRALTEICRLPQRQVDDEARWLRTQLLAGDTHTSQGKDR